LRPEYCAWEARFLAQDNCGYDFLIECASLRYRDGLHTIETTDPKEARRLRYAQHRGAKTTLTFGGSTVTGLVHSVLEDRFADPKRWIVRIIEK
jgi:hypothetical protein